MKENTPTIFVIFGATGDLSTKKLLPALYHLFAGGFLPSVFRVLGFSRGEKTREEFALYVRAALADAGIGASAKRKAFEEAVSYVPGHFDEAESYTRLALVLKQIDDSIGQCTNKLFHLAVPPLYYENIFRNLSESGLTLPCDEQNGWTRVLVEKPFGNDLKTAKKLDQLLGKLFREEQVFRIDHYLAKEALQNILAFRFSNSLFEPLWNKDHIESFEIRFFEKATLVGRGAYYDRVGALRDVGQNHMLQMLALVAMKRPADFSSAAIRAERAAVLQSIKPIGGRALLSALERGQYVGYREEAGVSRDSTTETYFKLKLHLSDERFDGVPFFLEYGRALAESRVDIIVRFKKVECMCEGGTACVHQNTLTFRVQPGEGISVRFWAKAPGFGTELVPEDLSFSYRKGDEERAIPDAYERVLFDCVRGDQTLFASTEEVLAEWKCITPIVENLDRVPLATYVIGGTGPGDQSGN